MDYAFEFIINNGGIDTEEDYPYKSRDGRCDSFRKNARVVSIDGYKDVPENDENALKIAVANQPVSVAIEGSGRAFQLYESGWLLFSESFCLAASMKDFVLQRQLLFMEFSLDHVVLILTMVSLRWAMAPRMAMTTGLLGTLGAQSGERMDTSD
ncbi:Low-temperature-induced cysteine proteinase [Dendrobium catenatum]|uniref:Low-temperature-induced cysteine proteinase n=1 Tax=Dendrobium catenatum TaxID=906689 RepID=A0A2I0V7C3_9ASPA|nr:Low-temperature-induced cysteine proteinase [Dendrobium catenatum]